MNNKKKWLTLSVGGLLLTGAGLSIAIDAGISKMQGGAWVLQGTLALIIFNGGLCLLVDSVRFK